MNTNELEQKVAKITKVLELNLNSLFPSFPFVYDIRGIDVLTLPISARRTTAVEQRRAFDQWRADMMRRFFTVVRIKDNNERTPGGNHDEVRMWHFIALATHRVNLIGHKRHGSIELTNRCNDHAQLLRPWRRKFKTPHQVPEAGALLWSVSQNQKAPRVFLLASLRSCRTMKINHE
jgi:hypothetical protein